MKLEGQSGGVYWEETWVDLFKYVMCVKFSDKQVFKPGYVHQIFISELELGLLGRIQGQMGFRPHRHTLLHGAHQYMRARKGSPMATARTTRNLTAMVCCRKPERFSYQMERSCCWQFG